MTEHTSDGDLPGLVGLLDLEQIEVDLYRGRSPQTSLQRVFGGQVAGQALVAAGRTVPGDRPVHSLHAYFLRPGDPSVPILYEVDRIRDGRSFTTRRVEARQHGKAIFSMSASFQVVEEGFVHQVAMPSAPDPETLPTLAELLEQQGDPRAKVWSLFSEIDLRVVPADPDEPEARRFWMRASTTLPDEPLVHACVLAFASDLTLLGATLVPHDVDRRDEQVQMASLDHALWFHRPTTADGWLLYDEESPSASGGRGLATGRIFGADGQLIASVVQEGLIRPMRQD